MRLRLRELDRCGGKVCEIEVKGTRVFFQGGQGTRLKSCCFEKREQSLMGCFDGGCSVQTS